MFFIFSIILILSEIAGHHCSADVDYCDEDMCPYQGTHVACNKTKDFGPACECHPELIDLTDYQELILHLHNLYRSRVASGKVECFYPATRMSVLRWDDKLAETAIYNVVSCIFAHDQCRSTDECPFAGQNIYMKRTRYINTTIEQLIREAISLWFEEQVYCSHSVLASYRKTDPQTGHFTLLVCDRHDRVGCALMIAFCPANPNIYNDKYRLFVIFTCNYCSTNIHGLQSYRFGVAASECGVKSTKYDSLCLDPINPNDLTWSTRP